MNESIYSEKRKRSKWAVNPINSSGISDVIVVQDAENKLRSSLFIVTISKYKIMFPDQKEVEVWINGKKMPINMKLSHRGIAYFEYQVNAE